MWAASIASHASGAVLWWGKILHLGLMGGLENLRRWTPTQRDAVEGLAGEIITQREVRPLRTDGKPAGYLYG